jgi:two-component system KDP operon response regulator KdpE
MSNTSKKDLVLVVEDHPKVLRFIEIDLKIQGFDVVATASGKESLELVNSKNPDIMVLDIRLPDMDGFEVLQELRKFSQLPVVAYSATPEYSTPALGFGANAFLAKPFEMEELVELIHQLVNHSE